MKRLVPTIAVLASLIFPVFLTLPAVAQELWGGARAGMTPDQIRSSFPNTVPEKPHQGQTVLRAPEITIQGEPYAPRFGFKNDKLVWVDLSFHGKQQPFSSFLQRIYNPVLAAMRAKYGEEGSHTQGRTSISTEAKHTWFTSERQITLHLVDYGNLKKIADGVFFDIRYKAAATGDLDKL